MMKSITLYVLLVGLPLTGLYGLLEWGQSLVPPPTVGGRWSVAEATVAACPGLPATSVLSIEQSGRFLRVRMDDMPFGQGRLDDGRVSASIPVALPGCGSELALEASLDDTGELLVGQLGLPGCKACPTTTLEAHRLPKE